MNKDWDSIRLGKACDVIRGSSPRPIEQYFTNDAEGVNWIKIGDTKGTDKFVTRTRQKITREGAEHSRKVMPGDLLLSNSMSYGKPFVMAIEGYVHDGWFVLRNFAETFDPDFFYILLTSNLVQSQFRDLAAGAVVKNISSDLVKRAVLPVPPLEEQKRIVSILDEAFATIAKAKENAEKNLKNARELFLSHLNHVFTQRGQDWSEKRLGDVALKFGRGKSRHRPRNDKSLYGGDYPFIQTGEIREANHFVTKFSQTYNEKGLAQSKLWPAGTLCITIAANIAETAILTFDACIPDSVIGLVCDKQKANVEYVDYLLQFFRSMLRAQGKGAAQDNINMGTFERNTFPFPTVGEQETIATVLSELATQTDRLVAIYSQKLANLEELKQSLKEKAFTGRLTAKAVEKEIANV